MKKSKTKNIHAGVFAARDHLYVEIAWHRSGSVPFASFHSKYSIQNSVDTERVLYMQDMDPGPAKILYEPEKGDS